MAELSLDRISKIYPAEKRGQVPKRAIDNLSFSVHDKEFMVIVGPSGCGKSTLLRMIAGLEEISEGTLSIDGKRMNELGPRDRDIAMVFQNYALYPHMTVYDNIAFGLKLRNYSKSEIRLRVLQAAELLEIRDELDRKPKTLSGGQRQRVAIGRAIVRRPKVFLFDEPLSNLDAKLRTQMRIELQKLHREINATMIYVTHDQTEAMTLGQRIVVLNKGVVMQVDSPLELYNHPANKFVAGFIGSPMMNFVKGKLIKGAEGYLVEAGEGCAFVIGAMIPAALEGRVGEVVEVGVRPENIVVRPGTAGGAKLEVTAYENMGNEQFVYFSVPGQTLVARRPSQGELRIGETYGVGFLPGKVTFFDGEKGQVIH